MPNPNSAYVDLVDEVKTSRITFNLVLSAWRAYADPPSGKIQWHVHPFDEQSATGVPTGPGVYAFVIHSFVAPELANYPIYIGKAEDGLRSRYREYLSERQSSKGRPRIVYYLNKWDGFVQFWYAELPPSEIVAAESALFDSLRPPVNKRYSARVARVMNAF